MADGDHAAGLRDLVRNGRRFGWIAFRVLRFLILFVGVRIARRFGHARRASPLPQAFRRLLEELGGLFVKFGQFVAMRPDIASPGVVREAEQLLDRAAPFPAAIATATIERELAAPLAALFRRFDAVPVAAASFAQVHHAELPDGTIVAVKVQRPGLERQVRADLSYLRIIVWLLEISGLTNRIRLTEMLDDFELWTLDELDLRKEAAFASAMRRSAVEIPNEYIPAIFWSHTNRRVLTLEFLTGVWMSDYKKAIETGDAEALAGYRARGIHQRHIAAITFENMLRQVFERNTFHGDPHAGNLVILDAETIGYVDFGITGQIDARFRTIQMAVLTALSESDFDGFFRAVIKLFYPLPNTVDLLAIRREMITGARNWANVQYNERAERYEKGTAIILENILRVARKYELSVSAIALRYFRAVIAIEAMILTLDPDFPYRTNLKRILLGIELRQARRLTTPDALSAGLIGLLALAQRLPGRLLQSVDDLDDTRRSVFGALHFAQTAAAWLLRWAARLAGVAGVAMLANLAFGLHPLPVATSLLTLLGLVAGSVIMAGIARRLYMASLPTSR